MADKNSQLNLRITVQNEASQVFTQIAEAANSFTRTLSEASRGASEAFRQVTAASEEASRGVNASRKPSKRSKFYVSTTFVVPLIISRLRKRDDIVLDGVVVKFSDGTYYKEDAQNKKTPDIQQATVFPKGRNNQWVMSQMGIKKEIEESTKETETEFVKVTFRAADIKTN